MIEKLTLSDKGERVDINYNKNNRFEKFDIFQKSHYRRYEFAKQWLNQGDIVGDLACGTGYGTSLLSENSCHVTGIDMNSRVIKAIKRRYAKNTRVEFVVSNILDTHYTNHFDKIVSFETVEHLEEREIVPLFKKFFEALKPAGMIIFSTPYMQEKNEKNILKGFHKTFDIRETTIEKWLHETHFHLVSFHYQNYEAPDVVSDLSKKDFIICVAQKTT
ncbi:MAG: class I SAM-dependent methyltransferase [Minisyncoccota bacterium]